MEITSQLYLEPNVKKYKYLYTDSNQVLTVLTINDKALYVELKECFETIGFTNNEILTIFKVVSAVLLLGNIDFIIKRDKLQIKNENILNLVCDLLSLDKDKLIMVLTRKPPIYGNIEYESLYTTELINYVRKLMML